MKQPPRPILKTPEDLAGFAQMMIDFHLKQAATWAEQWLKVGTPRDRTVIRRDFIRQCEQTVCRLKAYSGGIVNG